MGNYYLRRALFFTGNWHKQTLGRSAWEIIIYVGRYYLDSHLHGTLLFTGNYYS
jgi:hypothetical protein